ncbi:hypothetical protein IH779_03250 [Patescibacteria group bacterium]|nr:hypothetical protein [Patescibacteria group bacterium]
MQRFVLVAFGVIFVLLLISACGGTDQPVPIKEIQFPGGLKLPVMESEDPGCRKEEGCLELKTSAFFSQIPQELVCIEKETIEKLRVGIESFGDPEIAVLISSFLELASDILCEEIGS